MILISLALSGLPLDDPPRRTQTRAAAIMLLPHAPLIRFGLIERHGIDPLIFGERGRGNPPSSVFFASST